MGRADPPGDPLHWAVLNVAEGPGSRPDPHCLEAAGKLRNAGVRVLGHLDLAYGSRPFGELVSDAHRFLDWYRVDGFYLDRAPADRADLAGTRRLTATLEAVLGGEAHLVLGHGTHPHPGYAEVADQLVTFAGSWVDYRWSQVAEWTAEYTEAKFVHLVHGVPRTHLDEALRIARWQGAGTIFFTDRAGVRDKPRHSTRCPATGTKSSRGSDRVSRNEEGRGSVTGRTTVLTYRQPESPCRCHPWSSPLPSSP